MTHKVFVRDISRIVFVEGLRAGGALGACVVVLAIVGLTPSLSWLPEVPLVGGAIVLPVATYGLTGYRAGKRSGRVLAGTIAASLAGAISGAVGGVAYVLFGKPALNILVGVLLGAVGGTIVGTAGGWLSRRTSAVSRQDLASIGRATD